MGRLSLCWGRRGQDPAYLFMSPKFNNGPETLKKKKKQTKHRLVTSQKAEKK